MLFRHRCRSSIHSTAARNCWKVRRRAAVASDGRGDGDDDDDGAETGSDVTGQLVAAADIEGSSSAQRQLVSRDGSPCTGRSADHGVVSRPVGHGIQPPNQLLLQQTESIDIYLSLHYCFRQYLYYSVSHSAHFTSSVPDLIVENFWGCGDTTRCSLTSYFFCTVPYVCAAFC